MDGEKRALLELDGITKRFPGAVANDRIDLTLAAGRIHALLGENGAGKSTLVKIVYGLLQPDEGRILLDGEPVRMVDPREARRRGIGMVFQHFSLFESLTVAENIAVALDHPPSPAELAQRIAEISRAYGLAVDPRRYVHDLSVGERQRVEVLRCLLQSPRLLILDEPTSVLTRQEAAGLTGLLARLAEEGTAILYISHKIEEVRALCHDATILRQGRVVARVDPTLETAGRLAELMVGRPIEPPSRRPHRPSRTLLAVDRLSLASPHPFGVALKDVSLEVRAGEIVGIGGVAGNGQAELLLALSGEIAAPRDDSVAIGGRPVGRLGPRGRRALGMALVPEERLGRGAVPELTLTENALLTRREDDGVVLNGIIRWDRARAAAARVVERFGVVARGPEAEAGSLSGGNLQKFIVGREVMKEPSVLIVAAPTWGVDAGAETAIHRELMELADRGAAILVISQDLDELVGLCDRIAILFHGTLSPAVPVAETTPERLGLLMGGAEAQKAVVVNHAA